MERWGKTRMAIERDDNRRVAYLSLEFLMGRLLRNALLNLDIEGETEEALQRIGLTLEDVYDREHDAGLGNGGLGRLAACFLDSCATLSLPVVGYGIRYQYGMFRQRIDNGHQVEEPDPWLREGFPWETERFEFAQTVKFGGRTLSHIDAEGETRHDWVEFEAFDIEGETEEALQRIGLTLEDVYDREHDAGLGNGGLGRLAACFLDSCATLSLPVVGYGIRYQYGMFRQRIDNGHQVEEPDPWLREGFPWETERFEFAQTVKFGGRTLSHIDAEGETRHDWVDSHDVLAIPYDVPIPGYKNDIVNTLRLWSAAATDEFDLEEFNAGSYTDAVASKNLAENITMVLYPNTATDDGFELRLRQQYFLASASLQDTLRYYTYHHGNDVRQYADKNCIQLNDTHPAIAVAELMRLLIDEFSLDWDKAWDITRKGRRDASRLGR